jgi:hypothetical protein
MVACRLPLVIEMLDVSASHPIDDAWKPRAHEIAQLDVYLAGEVALCRHIGNRQPARRGRKSYAIRR